MRPHPRGNGDGCRTTGAAELKGGKMDKLHVSFLNGEKLSRTIIYPSEVKKCPTCNLPIDFHVCRQKEIDLLTAEIQKLKDKIHA